jgi:hypothetical protein
VINRASYFSFQNQIWEDCYNRQDDVDSRPDALLLKASRNSNSTVRTLVCHGPDTHSSDMEIACRRSIVRTAILMVQTREALVRKLLAADVRPSGRGSQTGKIFSENLKISAAQLSVRTAHDHHLDGAQLYQGSHPFEPSSYK